MDLRGMQLRDAYQDLMTRGSNGQLEDGEGNEISTLLRNGDNIIQFYNIQAIVGQETNLTTNYGIRAGILLIGFGSSSYGILGLDATSETVNVSLSNNIGTSQGDDKFNLYYKNSDLVFEHNHIADSLINVFHIGEM